MVTSISTCRLETTAAECARLMGEDGIGFVPVLDARDTLAGVVTDRDLAVRVLGAGRGGETPLSQVMSIAVVTCRPDDELAVAEERMSEARVCRVVMVDGRRRCLGVLSLSDIARVEESGRVGRVLRAVSLRESVPPPSLR